MLLKGKVAIVTGGGSGIGEAIGKLFAGHGASVVLADRDGQAANRVAAEINGGSASGSAFRIDADVSDEAAVQAVVAGTLARYGRIDILVNNAATILPKALEEVETAEWNRLHDVNLKSVYLVIKHAVPELRRTKGNIVNMASLNGLIGQRTNASYAATKGGVIAMTRSLALDYAPDGIRVNCICPAGVMTPLLRKWIEEQEDREGTELALAAMHPIGRIARPEEIAGAALFLASALADFVTGVALPVDGGASLGY